MVVAALINALKLVNKRVEDIKFVITGIGSVGTSGAKRIPQLGVNNIIGCDIEGAVMPGEKYDHSEKNSFRKTPIPTVKEEVCMM